MAVLKRFNEDTNEWEPIVIGRQGDAATIEIGTVTIGESASVVNVGTDSAAVLDFVIPVDGNSAYRHVQSVPSDEWTIEHNLGYRPAGILVTDSAGSIVEGDVISNTDTVTSISFTAAFSGTADLS